MTIRHYVKSQNEMISFEDINFGAKSISPGDYVCRKGDVGKEIYIIKRVMWVFSGNYYFFFIVVINKCLVLKFYSFSIMILIYELDLLFNQY